MISAGGARACLVAAALTTGPCGEDRLTLCEGGTIADCRVLAAVSLSEDERDEAFELYRMACLRGDGMGCGKVAHGIEVGSGI